jgi:LCP family protein required for cell wall assembly
MSDSTSARHAPPTTSAKPPRRSLLGSGRLVIALISAFVVALTGLGWSATRHLIGGMTVSQALGLDGPRSTDGSMNILLIGLDSRKDQNGEDLPQDILDQLHAGGSDDGGYNTNTLILAHITADARVVAFSIPRDDYVAVDGITGYDHIKIKQAYGLAKAQFEQKLVDRGVTDPATVERQGREAGRAATLRAVRNLTGVPIDYFAEITLAGFYDVTNALGGVDVCLNNAVQDDFSGADFPAGTQRLDAAQALAFVRQRHGLDNGDLDRTHRQQAFLVSVMHQLQQAGTFTDMTKLSQLMDAARKDIVLSDGWGDEQFRRLGQIAGGANVTYRTLPVLRYDEVDGESVNVIDPAEIRAQVAAAFGQDGAPPAPTSPSSTVDVINGGFTDGLAAEVSQVLSSRGYASGEVRNAGGADATATAILYGRGADSDAANLGKLLGIDAKPQADPTVDPGHVRVTLGANYALPASVSQVTDASATGAFANSGASGVPDGGDAPPDAGKPIVGNSVPCVD